MKPITHFLLLASLAAPALAQASSTPRTPRPIPHQSFEKVDALGVAATRAETRPASTRSAAPLPEKPFARDEGRTRVPARELDRLYYTTQRDGSTWVSGRTYKAGFGSDGATYVPFLGSQAPRNYPLELALASVTVDGIEIALEPAVAAVRDGDRIVIDRGPIDEVYELGLDSVEQTFVVGERPASGDLRFVVRLETEMTRSQDTDGFLYSNALGSVRYGRAFVREDDGDRVPVLSRAVDGGVEIVIGREYLENASFPLVVDPVITTFAIDNGGQDTWDADIAYDLSTDRYLTVYEFNFSMADGDVHAILRQADGSASSFALLDNTPENWRSPQCANLNAANQFLMVAQASNVLGAPDWNIWGITIDAATLGAGWKTLISTGDQSGPKYLGDVGGDSYDGPGGAYYCVVWRRDLTASDWDIHARLVTSQSTLLGTQTLLIDNSGSSRDSWPSVSKSNGTLGGDAAWTIAWHRELTVTNYDVLAARLSWDGVLLNAPTYLTLAPGFQYYPRVSSPLTDGRVLVIFGVDQGPDNDIHYALLSGTTVNEGGSLTQLDALPTLTQHQIEYCVDSDGQGFVVAYAESYLMSTFDYDVWISSFAVFGNTLVASESHRSLDYTAQQSLRVDVVAERSGGAVGSNRFFVAWDSTGSGGHDVLGGVYDRQLGGNATTYCFGDGSSGGCPCGDNGGFQSGCPNSQAGSGAYLVTTGTAQTGPGDSLSFNVNNVPINVSCTLFQGTGNSTSLFGDGIRCVSGTQIRIGTKYADGSGSATWPTGAEADVSVTGMIPAAGAQRFYQVSYRNSASFCTPATFNISSGVRVLWLL